ncbi:hypothetical protein D3C80_1708880 [compost metagenome]
MNQLVNLMPALLVHDQKTQCLDTATGRTDTTAEKACRQQQHNGVRGHFGIVGGGQPVIGHHRTGEEKTVYEGVFGAVHARAVQLEADNRHDN